MPAFNGLQQVINYMIPAVGTPRGFFWNGILTGAPVTIDFRNVSGGGIDGQVFRPSGVFIDNTQGTGPVTIVVNEIGYQMICLEGELLNLQFPAPVECTVSFVGDGQTTIAFVDFPVLPYRNVATAGGGALWGTIAGILSDQTDLQVALDAKISEPGGQTEGDVLTISSGTPKWEPPAGGGGVAFADITGDAFDNVNLGDYLNDAFAQATWGQINGTLSNQTKLYDIIRQTFLCVVGDETTAITTGTNKYRFFIPYANGFDLTEVKASLSTAQASGAIFTVDINLSGTTILSTKLTIDNTEKTSAGAAIQPVISTTHLDGDNEISIDIDQIGTSGATGLKVYLIGHITQP